MPNDTHPASFGELGQVINEETLEAGAQGGQFARIQTHLVTRLFHSSFSFVFYRTYCRRANGDVSLFLIWRPLIILHGLFSRVGSCSRSLFGFGPLCSQAVW